MLSKIKFLNASVVYHAHKSEYENNENLIWHALVCGYMTRDSCSKAHNNNATDNCQREQM